MQVVKMLLKAVKTVFNIAGLIFTVYKWYNVFKEFIVLEIQDLLTLCDKIAN
jgi:hypothetical protein